MTNTDAQVARPRGGGTAERGKDGTQPASGQAIVDADMTTRP